MSTLKRLKSLLSPNSITILAFYRYLNCPFCTTWARGLSAIRQLDARLSALGAKVIFISSQPVSKEEEAAQQFRFTPSRSLNSRVFFINDQDNDIAYELNKRWSGAVYIETRTEAYGGGGVFKNGMVQPGVICVHSLFQRDEDVSWRYCYDGTGDGGVNGGGDCVPACLLLRMVERGNA